MRHLVGILGTPLDILDARQTLDRMEQFICERQFHQVATANTDFLVNALGDGELRHILRQADLVVADGMPVVWAARALRAFLPERVTGADLVPALAARAAECGYRIYMLGAPEEVAQRAKANLLEKYPNLQIVGCVSPPVRSLYEMDHEAILSDILANRPDILLVAFGNPKQEKWIYMHRDRLQSIPICIGVGGTFDFLAQKTPRAPTWMQKHGLEWTYRLWHDPRRLWRRYVRDMYHFTRRMMMQWWEVRRGERYGRSQVFIRREDTYTLLTPVGDFTQIVLPEFETRVENALRAGKPLILDLAYVNAFDGFTLGALINLPKRAAFHHCDVRLIRPPAAVQNVLHHSCLLNGLFTLCESLEEAVASTSGPRLDWKVWKGQEAAVVKVTGRSWPSDVPLLEAECRQLLESGRRVDLDIRSLVFLDTRLKAMMYQLAKACAAMNTPFRVIPTEGQTDILIREKLVPTLSLGADPEFPQDAVEQPTPLSFTLSEAGAMEPLVPSASGVA